MSFVRHQDKNHRILRYVQDKNHRILRMLISSSVLLSIFTKNINFSCPKKKPIF